MMSEGNKYGNIFDNVWPPPSEATRARLQRLQELEEQRRQRLESVQQRSRSSSLDRGPSSSRELLFGSRSHLNRTSSFRSSGRRITYQTPSLSGERAGRSRSLQRSTSEEVPDPQPVTIGDETTRDVSDKSTDNSDKPSTTETAFRSAEVGNSVLENGDNIENKDSSSSSGINESSVERPSAGSESIPDESINSANDNVSMVQKEQGTETKTSEDVNSATGPNESDFKSEEEKTTKSIAVKFEDQGAESAEEGAQKPGDTEIEISSQGWSVSNDTDKKLQDMMTDKEARLAKLRELENLRMQGRVQEAAPEDSGMSARERFNLSHNVSRPQRQLSLREQIRRERRARRHSDLQLSSTSTFGTTETGTGSQTSVSSTTDRSGGATTERVSRAVNPESWDAAFSDDISDRMKRMKELSRLRKEGIQGASSIDSEFPSRSARDSYQVSYDYSSHGMFPLSSARSESMSSLLSSRRPFDLPLQFSSITEQREPSFPSSSSFLSRTSSTQDVLARARETLNSIPARRTANTTETTAERTVEQPVTETNNQDAEATEDSDEVPLYVEGAPQGVPYVDDEGRTHWIGPTSPKYNDIVTSSTGRPQLPQVSPRSTVMNMRETDDNPMRARQRNRGLPPEIQDHYLADCFDPKYTLKERIVLIRKKLWGDPPQIPNFDRGKPDGASHGEGSTAVHGEGSNATSDDKQIEKDVSGSDGTKTI